MDGVRLYQVSQSRAAADGEGVSRGAQFVEAGGQVKSYQSVQQVHRRAQVSAATGVHQRVPRCPAQVPANEEAFPIQSLEQIAEGGGVPQGGQGGDRVLQEADEGPGSEESTLGAKAEADQRNLPQAVVEVYSLQNPTTSLEVHP